MTSPAHTRSHRAASSSSSVAPGAPARRSAQKHAPALGQVLRAARRGAAPSGGRRRRPAAARAAATWSRKYSRTRPSLGAERRRHRSTPARPTCTARRGRPAGSRSTRWASTSPSSVLTPGGPRPAARRAPRPGRRGRAGPTPTPCQAGRKRASAVGLDRLDLLAQRGERAPPQLAQHLVVAPLPLDAVGPELAPHDPALGLQRLQRAGGPLDR